MALDPDTKTALINWIKVGQQQGLPMKQIIDSAEIESLERGLSEDIYGGIGVAQKSPKGIKHTVQKGRNNLLQNTQLGFNGLSKEQVERFLESPEMQEILGKLNPEERETVIESLRKISMIDEVRDLVESDDVVTDEDIDDVINNESLQELLKGVLANNRRKVMKQYIQYMREMNQIAAAKYNNDANKESIKLASTTS